jgi:hypothetical protein
MKFDTLQPEGMRILGKDSHILTGWEVSSGWS